MRESDPAQVAGVSERVLDELAQTLADKLDMLLDRLTDRALTVPDAGSPAWREQWLDRDTDSGRQHQSRRLHIRAVLANRAGIELQTTPGPAIPEPAAAPPTRARRARRGRVDDNQLAIF